MKKVFVLLLGVLMVGVIPVQFPQTAGNLKPVAVLAEIQQGKGEQK